jgi:hypothetical protein
MASPLSKSLIAGAILESGAMIKPTLAPITLTEATCFSETGCFEVLPYATPFYIKQSQNIY